MSTYHICLQCGGEFRTEESLQQHLNATGHVQEASADYWCTRALKAEAERDVSNRALFQAQESAKAQYGIGMIEGYNKGLAERDALLEQVKLITGKTALRCIEMAKWPQGLYDEQAFYGQMFAEFIEKEFRKEIDAALKEGS